MADSSDVLSRLSAALDEDERIARAVAPTPHDWHVDGGVGDTVLWWPPDPEVAERERRHGVNVTADRWQGQQFDHEPVASHVARHDPVRVLRQTAAIRQALADVRDPNAFEEYSSASIDHTSFMEGVEAAAELFVRALAGIYTEPTDERSGS